MIDSDRMIKGRVDFTKFPGMSGSSSLIDL